MVVIQRKRGQTHHVNRILACYLLDWHSYVSIPRSFPSIMVDSQPLQLGKPAKTLLDTAIHMSTAKSSPSNCRYVRKWEIAVANESKICNPALMETRKEEKTPENDEDDACIRFQAAQNIEWGSMLHKPTEVPVHNAWTSSVPERWRPMYELPELSTSQMRWTS